MELASPPPSGTPTPEAISRWAEDNDYTVDSLVWLSELGAITAKLTREEWPVLFAKWSPDEDLIDEAERLSWLSGRFPSPRMADYVDLGEGSLLVTVEFKGESAVSERWKGEPDVAARAIGEGLGRLHAMDPSDSLFGAPDWVGDQDDVDHPVVIHGDACAPNTLLADDGSFAGIVDVGGLGVADRWADLAVASHSIDQNFGPGHQDAFWEAYGEQPDEEKVRHYLKLWEG